MTNDIPQNALQFVQSPAAQRQPLGLSLSGGGFRATLFHLGAIRRLNEFGVLKRVSTLSSVSGGSILNGFLSSRLKGSISDGIANFGNEVSAPMREFCAQDIRRWLALESVIPGTHNSAGLAKRYDNDLTNGMTLAAIPKTPIHIFSATDLAFGVNWMFKQAQCGDYQAGFLSTPATWKLGTAIAASSCFPPVFKPMNLNLDPAALKGGRVPLGPVRDKCVREITFSDGGVYDNLGLEPIWKDHDCVLASDGGALFPVGGDTGFSWEIGRYISIPENQALAVRKRWLVSNFIARETSGPNYGIKGTYWGIGGTCSDYGINQGYSKDLARNYIAAIRTDLDSFSEAEASVLENHGYWLADAAIRRHVPDLIYADTPIEVPNPGWPADAEDRIKEALRDSRKRTLLGHS
jgi:NTE family protein